MQLVSGIIWPSVPPVSIPYNVIIFTAFPGRWAGRAEGSRLAIRIPRNSQSTCIIYDSLTSALRRLTRSDVGVRLLVSSLLGYD